MAAFSPNLFDQFKAPQGWKALKCCFLMCLLAPYYLHKLMCLSFGSYVTKNCESTGEFITFIEEREKETGVPVESAGQAVRKSVYIWVFLLLYKLCQAVPC